MISRSNVEELAAAGLTAGLLSPSGKSGGHLSHTAPSLTDRTLAMDDRSQAKLAPWISASHLLNSVTFPWKVPVPVSCCPYQGPTNQVHQKWVPSRSEIEVSAGPCPFLASSCFWWLLATLGS